MHSRVVGYAKKQVTIQVAERESTLALRCVQQYQESLPLFKMLLALLWQHCAVYSCSRKRTAAGTALCVQLYDVRARSGLSTCMKGTVLDQESMKGTVLDQESPFP